MNDLGVDLVLFREVEQVWSLQLEFSIQTNRMFSIQIAVPQIQLCFKSLNDRNNATQRRSIRGPGRREGQTKRSKANVG